MVKHIFFTFAALLIYCIVVSSTPIKTDHEIIKESETTSPSEAEVETATAVVEKNGEKDTIAPSTTEVITTRKPVLVLIRDALKKVTTGLPTEQVTNNALQYFQLFEHFIQQTIEQVIDATDEEEEETVTISSTVVTDDDTKPETAEKQPLNETGISVPVSVKTPAKEGVNSNSL